MRGARCAVRAVRAVRGWCSWTRVGRGGDRGRSDRRSVPLFRRTLRPAVRWTFRPAGPTDVASRRSDSRVGRQATSRAAGPRARVIGPAVEAVALGRPVGRARETGLGSPADRRAAFGPTAPSRRLVGEAGPPLGRRARTSGPKAGPYVRLRAVPRPTADRAVGRTSKPAAARAPGPQERDRSGPTFGPRSDSRPSADRTTVLGQVGTCAGRQAVRAPACPRTVQCAGAPARGPELHPSHVPGRSPGRMPDRQLSGSPPPAGGPGLTRDAGPGRGPDGEPGRRSVCGSLRGPDEGQSTEEARTSGQTRTVEPHDRPAPKAESSTRWPALRSPRAA